MCTKLHFSGYIIYRRYRLFTTDNLLLYRDGQLYAAAVLKCFVAAIKRHIGRYKPHGSPSAVDPISRNNISRMPLERPPYYNKFYIIIITTGDHSTIINTIIIYSSYCCAKRLSRPRSYRWATAVQVVDRRVPIY